MLSIYTLCCYHPEPYFFGHSILKMKPWLTLVLALVIALQSLAAIGETAHHLAPSQHEHAHEGINIDSAAPELAEPSDSSNPSLDHSSDHCHHNHSHFLMALLNAAADIAVLLTGQHSSDYQASHTSVIPPSLFRPPIA